jgi:mRNA interferase RelE/StbE
VTRGPWQVRYARQAEKELGRLDPPIRQRIVAAIDRLATGDAIGIVRLRGTEAAYRLRVGDWRVIFRRLDDEIVILVIPVLPRGRAYDR